ncbi:MAG TPA: hypothetical protein VJ577_08580 [Burkholderiaceae bacterium]|nr:hypothetical protein [Burkholderiaceae bacterium]
MNSNLFSGTRGFFSVASGVAVLNGKFSGPMADIDLSAPDNAGFVDDELTRRHEISHYRHLMTTPFGLLIWRTYNTIISHAEFISRALKDIRPPIGYSLPIHEWVKRNPVSGLAKNGRCFTPDRIGIRTANLESTAEFIDYLNGKVHVLTGFLNALLYGKCETIGAFISLANDAFVALAEASDIAPSRPWRTNLPLDTSFPRGFCMAELVEANARLDERRFLEAQPNAKHLIEAWEARSIHGMYERAYRYLMHELGDVDAALCVVDAAIMSPIDPAFSTMVDDGLVIEQILPSFRLAKLVEEATKGFWPVSNQDLHTFLGSQLAEKCGLIAPLAVARHGITADYSGPTSWGSDHRLYGYPEVTNLESVYRFTEGEVRRAMKWRSNDFTSVVRQHEVSDPYVFRPLMTFYRDNVVFGFNEEHYNLQPEGSNIALLTYKKFVSDCLTLSLLSANCEEELNTLVTLSTVIKRRALEGYGGASDWFSQGFANHGVTQGDVEAFFDVARDARSILGAHYSSRRS